MGKRITKKEIAQVCLKAYESVLEERKITIHTSSKD